MDKKLGDILVEKGYITPQQLQAALSVQGEQQVGQLLITWGFITQEQLLDALDIQAPPPPPPPPPPAPAIQQPVYPQPTPDLTMDKVQASKFKMDLKTLIYIGSLLVMGITGYFTFMAELDTRFNALESGDKDLMIEMDKRLTELENRFTPIGDGVYAVDPSGTWPPSRSEYNMKDQMARNSIKTLQEKIEDLTKEIEKLENKVYGN